MKILKHIARGGFGRVEKVKLNDGSIVARKVFDPLPNAKRETDPGKLIRRFKREVALQSKLGESYDNFFIPVLEKNLEGSELWFTMPIAQYSFQDKINEGFKDLTEIVENLADILNALSQLHELHFIHRDLKPSNILFHDARWKLSDFGLALPPLEDCTTKLTSDSIWGTDRYLSPEQYFDFHNVEPSADIYSFGCILHDVFGKEDRVPYRQHTCDGDVGVVIEKCTEYKPNKRFKNISDLRNALLDALSTSPNLSPSLDTQGWISELEVADQWSLEKLRDFVKHLDSVSSQDDETAIFYQVDTEKLDVFHKIDYQSWKKFALKYCRWTYRDFDFSYCDVVISRLESIFNLGDAPCKVDAVMAAVNLGWSHNRWYVMSRVVSLCSKTLDDSLASRIAIEIEVEELQEKFISCSIQGSPYYTINPNVDPGISRYHPRVCRVLQKYLDSINF